MNLKLMAEEIRRRVTMEQLLDVYGYKTKRGKMVCPFHGDKNASLHIYPDTGGWHCFGCGRGGSVIDFVMEQEGVTLSRAIDGIDRAFGLGLAEEADPISMSEEMVIRQAIDRFAEALNEQADITEKLIEIAMDENTKASRKLYAKKKQELTADEWTKRIRLDDEMADLEDRRRQVEKIREEVRQWKTTKYQELRTLMRTRRKNRPGAR